jgi:creatinine amidohydrolase
MSEAEVERMLKEKYDIPSPSEIGLPNTYIQTTPRHRVIERRRKNDVVIVPVGCTENHGKHTVSGLDSFMCQSIVEAVRRASAKKGDQISIAYNPLPYGAHPYHHLGMPGTVMLPQSVAAENLIAVMLGLWNDGFRKQIYINNHGQLWVLETALHEFLYRYQLPGIFKVMDWHRAIREFFFPGGKDDLVKTPFVHADESETSVALLTFPEGMVELDHAEEASVRHYFTSGRFDNSTDSFHRPQRWSESEMHFPITFKGTPEGVVGKPATAEARKAKRPILGICEYLMFCVDEILEKFPPGKVPPVEEVTYRTEEEMEPYLREPGSPGWKSVYGIPRIGM